MTVNEAITLLGLTLPTTPTDVKKAYYAKAKLWHPDNFDDYRAQLEGGQKFIKAKQAYDFLLSIDLSDLNTLNARHTKDAETLTRNRTTEAPAYSNEVPLFKTPVFKELDNVFSLFSYIGNWAIFNKLNFSRLFNFIKQPNQSLWHLLLNAVGFILVGVVLTLLGALLFPLAFFGAILFIPLVYGHIYNLKGFTSLLTQYLGYAPSPNCGHSKGERLYLIIRLIYPTITITVGLYIVYNYTFGWWGIALTFGFWVYIALVLPSLVYEWVLAYKAQRIRQEIKQTYST